MGTYTELVLKCCVKPDIPEDVDRILRFLFKFERSDFEKSKLPDHDFFKKISWEAIGVSSSQYHIPQAMSFYNGLYLFTRFDIKNYHNEIYLFLDWLLPYIGEESGQFLGWIMAERQKEPLFLYMPKEV